MEKPFKKKQAAGNLNQPGSKKVNVHLPYSNPSEKRTDQQQTLYNPDPKKTQIGRQAGFPPPSQQDFSADGDSLICPKCAYPLRIKPASSSPCPNCGFSGDIGNTCSDSGKTMAVNSLEEKSPEIREFAFYLIREYDDAEIKIESPEEDELILNRTHLDPDNSTISEAKHVKFSFRNSQIYMDDQSSNGSTFIQARNAMPLGTNTGIVTGNKILRFIPAGSIPTTEQSNATKKIGEFDMNGEQPGPGFNLIDENTGQQISFRNTSIINRSNLDPGNNTISGSRHAEITRINGAWYIKDLSSNESTFVQCTSEQILENGMRIILGNRIFRFKNV
jgi:hypothetical protein